MKSKHDDDIKPKKRGRKKRQSKRKAGDKKTEGFSLQVGAVMEKKLKSAGILRFQPESENLTFCVLS